MAEKKPNCEQPNPNESRNTTPKLNPNDPTIKRPERNMPAEKSAKGSQNIKGFTQPKNKSPKTLGAFNSTSKSYEEIYLEAMASKKNPHTVDEITERREKNPDEVGQTYETEGKKYVDIKDTQNRKNKDPDDVDVPQTKKFKYQEFEENVVHRTKEENAVEIAIDRPQKYKEETFNTTQAQKGREDVIIPTNERSTKFNSSEDVTKDHPGKTSSELENFNATSSPKTTGEEEFTTTAPTSSPKENDDISTPPYQVNYKVFNAENITVNAPKSSSKTEKDYDTTAPTESPKTESGPEVKVEDKSPKSEFNVETNISSKEKSEEDIEVKDSGIEKSEEDIEAKDTGIEKSEEDITAKTKYWPVKDELPTEPKDPGIEKDELDVETNLDATEKEREDLDIKESDTEKSEQIITEEANPNAATEKNKAEFFDDAEEINTGSIRYEGKSGYRINIFKETNRESVNKVDQSGETVSWDKYSGVESPEFEDGNEPVSNIHGDGTAVNKHMDYSQSNTQSRYGKGVRYEKDDGDREEFPGQSSLYYREITERTNIGEPLFSTNKTNAEIINRNTNYSQEYEFTVKADGLKEEVVNWNNYKTEGTNTPNEVENFEDPIVYLNDFVNSNFNYSAMEHSYSVKTDGLRDENINWNNYKTEPVEQEETDEPVDSTGEDGNIGINRNTNYSSVGNHTQKLSESGENIIWTNYSVDGDTSPNDIDDDTDTVSTVGKDGSSFINKNIEYSGFEVRTNLDESEFISSSDELSSEEQEILYSTSKEKSYSKKDDVSLENIDDNIITPIANWDFSTFENDREIDDLENGELESTSGREDSYSKNDSTEYEHNLLEKDSDHTLDTSISTNYNYTDYSAREKLDVDNFDDDKLSTINRTTKINVYSKNSIEEYENTNNIYVEPINNYSYYSEDYDKIITDRKTDAKDDANRIKKDEYTDYDKDHLSRVFGNKTVKGNNFGVEAEGEKDWWEIIHDNADFDDVETSFESYEVSTNFEYNRVFNYYSGDEQDFIENKLAIKNSTFPSIMEGSDTDVSQNLFGELANTLGLAGAGVDYGDASYKFYDISESNPERRNENKDIYYDPLGMTFANPGWYNQVIHGAFPDLGRSIDNFFAGIDGIMDVMSSITNLSAFNERSDSAAQKILGNIGNQSTQWLRKQITDGSLVQMIGAHNMSKEIYDPKGFRPADELMDQASDFMESVLGDPIQKIGSAIKNRRPEGPQASQFTIDKLTRGVKGKKTPPGINRDTGITRYFYNSPTGSNGGITDALGGDLILTENIALSPSHLGYGGSVFNLDQPYTAGRSKFAQYRAKVQADMLENATGNNFLNNSSDLYYDGELIVPTENVERLLNNNDQLMELADYGTQAPYSVDTMFKQSILNNFIIEYESSFRSRSATGNATQDWELGWDINKNRASGGGIENLPVDRRTGKDEPSKSDYRALGFTRKPISSIVDTSFDDDIFSSLEKEGRNDTLRDYINKQYNGLVDGRWGPESVLGGNQSIFGDDIDFNPLSSPINLFKIEEKRINEDDDYRRKITPIDYSSSMSDGDKKVFYINNLIQSEGTEFNGIIDFKTDGEANVDDSYTDPHLIEYLLPSEDQRDRYFAQRLDLRGKFSRSIRGKRNEDGNYENDDRGDDYFGNLFFYDELFDVKTENFYEDKSDEDIRRVTPIVYRDGSNNFYINNIENNNEYFKYRSTLEENLDYENTADESINLDPHFIEYSSDPGDPSGKAYRRDIRGKLRNSKLEDNYTLFLDDLSKIEVGGTISNEIKNEEFNKKDYITIVNSDNITYDDGDETKSIYHSFLNPWGDDILDRSSHMLSSVEDNLSSDNYIDPHLIEYNSIEDRTINLHDLGPKGEFYKFLTNEDEDMVYNAFDNLSLIQSPRGIDEENVNKIFNFEAGNRDSEILWRDINDQDWGGENGVKTNSEMSQPRFREFDSNAEINDTRFNDHENIVSTIDVIDTIKTSFRESNIDWHNADPANSDDYDTLSEEEIKKASIIKTENDEYDGSEIVMDLFEGYGDNNFSNLFETDNELGLVGRHEDLPPREWDDGAALRQNNRGRPFALKKPLRINTFGYTDDSRNMVEINGILNHPNDISDSSRARRLGADELNDNWGSENEMGIQDANANNQRRNMMMDMSNKGQYFMFINDDGEARSVENNNLDSGTGYIAALENPNDSIDDPRFSIPFQFSAELTGEQRAADWATETAIGRTAEWYLWSRTSTRTIQLKTNYVITAPSSPGSDRTIGDTSGDDSLNFLSDWNQEKVINSLNKFRALILPLSTEDRSQFMPPTVVIVMNNYLLTSYQGSGGTRMKKLSRWVAQDVNIDPQYDFGMTATRDPIAYEINITLKEVFPWTSIQTWETFNNQLIRDSSGD